MIKFFRDQSGASPITFYGILLIAGAVSVGMVMSRSDTRTLTQSGLLRIRASAQPCTNQVLGTKFGSDDCRTKSVHITGDSIVFLKAKTNN